MTARRGRDAGPEPGGDGVTGRGTDGAIDDLDRWAADVRARDAAEARARERWLRTQAEEEATLAGLLLDAAERRGAVSLQTKANRTYSGRIRSVGRDFVAIRASGAPLTLVAISAVALIVPDEPGRSRPAPPASSGSGSDRDAASLSLGLADMLAQAAGDRPRVSVDTGAQVVVGDLRTVGSDVITVTTPAGASPGAVGRLSPAQALIPLQSLSAISFLDSG